MDERVAEESGMRFAEVDRRRIGVSSCRFFVGMRRLIVVWGK